jgi:peptide/nickel transport system permease protein
LSEGIGDRRRARRARIWVGGLVVALAVFAATLAPWLGARDPYVMDAARRLQPPSLQAPFGTDNYGRDVLARVLYGARISLTVGVASVAVATLLGAFLGLTAGFHGGVADWTIMRIADVTFSIPSVLLALVLLGFLGSSLTNVAIAISIVYIPVFARLTRGEVLALRERAFVEAARAVGAGSWHIAWRHLVPNLVPLLVIQATINLALAIVAESSLAYLGLGTQPPAASWGRMLSEARTYLSQAPWMAVFPGLTLMLTVVGFNLLGDGLRDLWDPRLRD